jgi:hypothetical protein
MIGNRFEKFRNALYLLAERARSSQRAPLQGNRSDGR